MDEPAAASPVFAHPLPLACAFRASGPDAWAFLQSQATQDLRPLRGQPGAAAYTLWLDRKGKVIADGFVVTLPDAPDSFGLVSYATPTQVLRDHLAAKLIADEVELLPWVGEVWEDDGAPPEMLTVWGAAAASVAESWRAAGALVWSSRRRPEAWDVLLAAPRGGQTLPPAPANVALSLVAAEEVEAARISAGWPAVPQDIGAAELPQEGRLETVAISFTKGCYLGQEVMARLHAMGRPTRELLVVEGAGERPTVPQAVMLAADGTPGGETVGRLTSVAAVAPAHWAGLALVKSRAVGATVQLSAGSHPIVTWRRVSA